MAQPPNDDALASADEVEAVRELRAALAPELAALAAEGRDFPHTSGDIFLLRVVRGNDGNVAEARAWYSACLEARRAHGFDEIHLALEAASTPWEVNAMPHSAEALKYCNTFFGETEQRTSKGNIFWYDGLGDLRPVELIEELGWEKFMEFSLYAFEKRACLLDRLSREQGRLVKMVRVVDCDGAVLGYLNTEFVTLYRSKLQPILSTTSAEVLEVLFIINAPWWIASVWAVLSRTLPSHMVKRARILGYDYLQDEEFLSVVGTSLAEKLVSCRRSCHSNGNDEDRDGPEGGPREIAAGMFVERTLRVGRGQYVSWEFCVGTPSDHAAVASRQSYLGGILNLTLGESTDVNFSVSLWSECGGGNADGGGGDADGGGAGAGAGDGRPPGETRGCEGDLVEEVLVKSQAYSAAEGVGGVVCGSAEVPRAGLVSVRWSNEHSWVRSKMLASFRLAVGDEPGLDAAHGQPDGSPAAG